MYPFTITHRSETREPLTFYVPTAAERDAWVDNLTRATHEVWERARAHPLFARRALSADTFAAGVMPADASLARESLSYPEVTCAAPFALEDRTQMLAVGTSDGVWIGLYAQPNSFHKVLHLRGVTLCAVLQDVRQFLVLADRSLIAYDLEALVPSTVTPRHLAPEKLGGNRDVLFFAVGELEGRRTVVYAKRRTNETSIRLLEPVGSGAAAEPRSLWHRRPSAETFAGFREVAKFYVGYEATGVQFLAHSLVVCTHRGFQVYRMGADGLDPLPMARSGVRDELGAAVLKRVEAARPLAVYALAEDLLVLCYDRMACYTDRAGHLVLPERAFEWERRASRVAYTAGYLVAFCASFLEVRDASTGRMVRIVPGTDWRMLTRQDTAQAAMSLLVVERVPASTTPTDVQCVAALEPIGHYSVSSRAAPPRSTACPSRP